MSENHWWIALQIPKIIIHNKPYIILFLMCTIKTNIDHQFYNCLQEPSILIWYCDIMWLLGIGIIFADCFIMCKLIKM